MDYKNLSPDDHGRRVVWLRQGKAKRGRQSPEITQYGTLALYSTTHAFVTFKDILNKSADAKAAVLLADIEFVGIAPKE